MAIIDLLSAYQHAENDDKIIMIIQGCLVELMVLTTPQIYRTFMSKDKKENPILYVKI